jgi:hypothetical protein
VGALLVKLVKNCTDSTLENRDDLEQRHADAFRRVLTRAAHGNEGCEGCGIEPTAPTLVVVHRYPDGTAHLEDGPPIPVELADRLANSADEITATHSSGEIRYGQRRRRRPTSPTAPRG